MVFLTGPRQCGKTTLAKLIGESHTNCLYFNWDIATDKKRLIEDPYFFQNLRRKDDSTPLVILDEIHKYKEWKNYLKGAYDGFQKEFQFLVSGSGRLDLYQKGGDSLAGRYYAFHLWPFTLAELGGTGQTLGAFLDNPLQICNDNLAEHDAIWNQLAQYSGFPEPYLAAKIATYRRWSRTYHRQLIREDIRDLTDVKNTDDMEILFALLPSKVTSPLSIPSLAGDLKVSYNTVKSWLGVFDRFFLTFTLTPWAQSISRALHKERKTYLVDYALIEDPGAKFENMVAVELLRAVSAWNDMGGGNFELGFIRTKEGREVDFVLVNNRRPILLIEAKLGDEDVSPNLKRFQSALQVPAVQLVNNMDGFKRLDNNGYPLLVASASRWIPNLP
jgi:predicted AAA+ superfamily ATPase